jgi:hypothetical protein
VLVLLIFLVDYFWDLAHLVGLDIAQNGVHISSSKPAGEAFVAFMNMDNALRALEFNRMNMGHRYGKLREKDKKKHYLLGRISKEIHRSNRIKCVHCCYDCFLNELFDKISLSYSFLASQSIDFE